MLIIYLLIIYLFSYSNILMVYSPKAYPTRCPALSVLPEYKCMSKLYAKNLDASSGA